jgi:hypothetical protein
LKVQAAELDVALKAQTLQKHSKGNSEEHY